MREQQRGVARGSNHNGDNWRENNKRMWLAKNAYVVE